jgi:hypothetical protein
MRVLRSVAVRSAIRLFSVNDTIGEVRTGAEDGLPERSELA